MRTIQTSAKKLPKNDREQAVLFGLIELYIKSNKPIGSQTLLENGFESLSSATIRNYFSKLEGLGYLTQQHTSGGRIPTAKGLRLYADHFQGQGTLDGEYGSQLEEVFKQKDREIAALIHQAAETLSRLSKCAVFISMPRFDHDFIQDVRLLSLEKTRLLSVLITDFGLIRTETLFLETEVDEPFLRKCEDYFRWRLGKGSEVAFAAEEQAMAAQWLYNELMVRHVVGYLNYPSQEVLRCGVSRLLAYPEFSDASSVVGSLALLEDVEQMREILQDCCKRQALTYRIGEELLETNAVIAIPYKINQSIVGAAALLGPNRLPYRELFGLMRHFSELLTKSLTETVYKFKITFRHASGTGAGRISSPENARSTLLEDKTREP